MGKTIMATEAVRKFSELLNIIKFRGEHYIITRGGKPVASLGPVEMPLKERTLGELKDIWKEIPRLGEDGEDFARDLEEIIRHQPPLPEAAAWE